MLAVICMHGAVATLLLDDDLSLRPVREDPAPISAELYVLQPETDAQVIEPPSEPTTLTMPELPEPMTLATTDESTLELPQIDPQVAPNVGEYSEQAGLADGDTAVVTLTVDVGADGAVISAQVIKSNGGEVANEAAVAYARATRWIPGKVDGVPRAMQASLTVILGERA